VRSTVVSVEPQLLQKVALTCPTFATVIWVWDHYIQI
jgi:hypothetical protein